MKILAVFPFHPAVYPRSRCSVCLYRACVGSAVSAQAAITNGTSVTARGVSGGHWVLGPLGMLRSLLCKPSVEHQRVGWAAQPVYLASPPRFLRDFFGVGADAAVDSMSEVLAFEPEFGYAMCLRSVFETALF